MTNILSGLKIPMPTEEIILAANTRILQVLQMTREMVPRVAGQQK